MILENFNFFVILSIVSAVFALSFVIYSSVAIPFQKWSRSFIIYSSINIIVSISTFITLATGEYRVAFILSYLLFVSLILSPVALLHFVINFLKNKLSELNKYLRLLLYIPSFIIIAVVYFCRCIDVSSSEYGYLLYIPNLAILYAFFFTTMYIIVIAIISFEIHKNSKLNKSNKAATILLSGLGLYFISNVVYYPLYMAGFFNSKLPIQSIYLFILYIFTTAAMLSVKGDLKDHEKYLQKNL